VKLAICNVVVSLSMLQMMLTGVRYVVLLSKSAVNSELFA